MRTHMNAHQFFQIIDVVSCHSASTSVGIELSTPPMSVTLATVFV